MVLIDPSAQELTLGTVTESGERAARRTLREQIARLEAQLADCVATAMSSRALVDAAVPGAYGPRVLGIAELERVRDDLAARVGGARRALTARGLEQERARVRLERMLLEPGRHRFERVSAEDLGEGGCGVYQVRPRLGLIGMLAGWWHVKLSSGCPLATSHPTMGKRSRKRGATIAPPPPTAAEPVRARAAAPVSRRARMSEAPKAPWSPFPLTELVILLALVMLALGFLAGGDRRGTFIGIGLVLASLGGGELALREHFSGFRSHTSLLAALCGFVAGALAWVLGAPRGAILVVALAAGAAAFPLLRRAFKRRSGGLGFRA